MLILAMMIERRGGLLKKVFKSGIGRTVDAEEKKKRRKEETEHPILELCGGGEGEDPPYKCLQEGGMERTQKKAGINSFSLIYGEA
jgi:hypothetical protein